MTEIVDTNPKTVFGRAKPSVNFVPPVAILEVGRVMEVGAAKYGPMNWRDQPVTNLTYINAALRHIFKYLDGQDNDEETNLPELAHACASLMIAIDAGHQATLIDDRATPGYTASYIVSNTKAIA